MVGNKEHIATRYRVAWYENRVMKEKMVNSSSIKFEDAQRAEQKARLMALNRMDTIISENSSSRETVALTEEYIYSETLTVYNPQSLKQLLSPERTTKGDNNA